MKETQAVILKKDARCKQLMTVIRKAKDGGELPESGRDQLVNLEHRVIMAQKELFQGQAQKRQREA